MQIRIIIFLLLMVFLGACNESKVKYDLQGQTMGTQYHISVVSPKSSVVDKEKLKNKIDKILSRH